MKNDLFCDIYLKYPESYHQEDEIREPYGTIHGKYEVVKCTKIPVFGSLKPVIKETWSFNNLMTRTDEIIKIWMPVKIS